MTKKIVIGIFSLLIIGALTFCIVWGVTNYDVVKQAMSGTSLYTKEDIDAAYKDGYDTALTDKENYVALIEQYRSELTELQTSVNTLTEELAEVEKNYGASSMEAANLRTQLDAANKKIINLETSIETYEQVLSELETENKIIATFMYDGAVYAVQVYDSETTLTIEAPSDTATVKFNGWTVDGEIVDLSTFVITESTTFVADLTYYCTVTFTVEGETHDTQTVVKGTVATLPEEPTLDGSTFLGWSLDGVNVVDVATEAVTSNVEYVAIFSASWVIYSEEPVNVAYAWTDGDNAYYSYGTTHYVLDEETSTWESIAWNIETLYGNNVWTDGNNVYYSRSTTHYVLDKATSTWKVKTWNGLTDFYGGDDYIWSDGTNIYYSAGTKQYVLNKSTSTWSTKAWNGLTDFDAGNVWTDGNNVYYSQNKRVSTSTWKRYNYVLNKSTSTWETTTWNGLTYFNGSYIWSDGDNVYFSYGITHYVLNKETLTWQSKKWNPDITIYGYEVFHYNDLILVTAGDITYKKV